MLMYLSGAHPYYRDWPANSALFRKLGQQYADHFSVLELVGCLAHRLESPPPWKIHPVISVQHLKPVPSTDPFAESSQSRKLRSTDVSERFSNDTDCHDVATTLGTRFRYLGRYKTPKKEYLTHGKVTSYFSCRYTDVGSKDSSQLILLDGTLVSKSQVIGWTRRP
jgi:hypothetical protein